MVKQRGVALQLKLLFCILILISNSIYAANKTEASAKKAAPKTAIAKPKPIIPTDKVELVYGDIVMDKTAKGMKAGDVEGVLFPHWFHRIRFRCKVCHEDVFKTEKGSNNVDMDAISAGESCGMCHDGAIATDSLECESCHFYPLAKAKPVKKKEAVDPKSILFAGRSGKIAGKGDRRKPAGTAYKWGTSWQPRALSIPGLPKDKFGLIDWIKLTRDGIVIPKGSIDPNDPLYESGIHYDFDEDGDSDIEDILIESKSDTLADVVFPHTLHAWWLNCKSCHPKRFVRTAGDTKMTMKEMGKGKYCGECHGKVAFPLEDCQRCHNKAKEAACRKTENCISD